MLTLLLHLLLISPVHAATGIGVAPDAPTNLAVEARYAKKVIVSWDAVPDAEKYTVNVYTKNGAGVAVKQDITGTTATLGKRILTTNKPYYFVVKAVDSDDDVSDFSDRKSFRTKPAKVQDVKLVSADATNALVSWKKPKRKIRYYLVQVRSGGKAIRTIKKTTELQASTPQQLVSGLDAGTSYRFRVRAAFNNKNKGKYSKTVKLDAR